MLFSELPLNPKLLKGIEALGFKSPTPVQEATIGTLIEKDRDLIGLAQTGTGKTAAFGLPMIEKINVKNSNVQGLIIAPTRELCVQISNDFKSFSKFIPEIQVATIYGGASMDKQSKEIKSGAQIVVATPGRLLDLIQRKMLRIDQIEYCILDEADEMLNMGFKDDLDDILSYTGDAKNTWLFSATMPKEIRNIVKSYMSKPVEVKVSTGNQLNENIEHQYAVVKSSDKFEGLKRVLDVEEEFRGVIFCRTRIKTQQLADDLNKSGYQSEALHGDLSQAQRDRVMKRFKNHTLQVLVATDVAARGIDVNDLTHVIHYALPDDPSYYTHRSGRTARAGKKGISLSILTNRDMRKLDGLEKALKLKIDKISIPSVEDILNIRLCKWANNLLNFPIRKDLNGKLLTDIQMLLGSLSYEELVEKLVSKEIDALNYNKKGKDLNESEKASKRSSRGDSDRRSKGRDRKSDKRDRSKSDFKRNDKADKKSKKSNKKGARFFINVGKLDGVSKSDLVDFISETARIRKSDVGDVDLQKKCSFFEVDGRHSKNLANSFKGIYIDGRELRVNRDSK